MADLELKLREAQADIKCLVDALERVTIGYRPYHVQALLDVTKKANNIT